MRSGLTGAIVGREAELGAVGRFLDRVALGPAALVIEGEAGIGKTTLWQEAIAAAEARSFKVLRAQPTEPEATLSYGALTDLVGVVFEETRAVLPAPQPTLPPRDCHRSGALVAGLRRSVGGGGAAVDEPLVPYASCAAAKSGSVRQPELSLVRCLGCRR